MAQSTTLTQDELKEAIAEYVHDRKGWRAGEIMISAAGAPGQPKSFAARIIEAKR